MARFELNYLIGKTISDLEIDLDKTVIRLKVDGKTMYLECYADCCSESWIEHIDLIKDVDQHHIVAIKEARMVEIEGTTRQSWDKLYGITLITDKLNEIYIDFRNSSNGYYGGSLELTDDYYNETDVFKAV